MWRSNKYGSVRHVVFSGSSIKVLSYDTHTHTHTHTHTCSVTIHVSILSCFTTLMRKYSFSQRVINEWDKLPNDCVNASSVNMFKNRIDRYLIRVGYT